MVEISKTLTKIVRIIVKYTPFVIGVMYFIQSILFCFGIVIPWLTITYRFSILSLICMLAMSVLLKFCIWHRLPLYYGASIDIINTIDYYITIPISNKSMLVWYLVITGIFILIGMYLKERHNAKNRTT
jgi:hypothetical protein